MAACLTDSLATVKYFGRDMVVGVNDRSRQDAVDSLFYCVSDLQYASQNRPEWGILAVEMESIAEYVANPDISLKKYQMEILNQALLPCLQKVNYKTEVDQQRFQQVSALISSLVTSSATHPAVMLLFLEDMGDNLRGQNRRVMTKHMSSLFIDLRVAVDRQWVPILTDITALLLNIGGKFLVVGLMGVVGWPMVFMYPLYRVALNMATIAAQYETQQRISWSIILDLVKTLVVAFACAQLLSILRVYASVGYFCLFAGACVMVLVHSKPLLKQSIPLLAPHLVQLDALVCALDKMDFKGLIMAAAKQNGFQPPDAEGEGEDETPAAAPKQMRRVIKLE